MCVELKWRSSRLECGSQTRPSWGIGEDLESRRSSHGWTGERQPELIKIIGRLGVQKGLEFETRRANDNLLPRSVRTTNQFR